MRSIGHNGEAAFPNNSGKMVFENGWPRQLGGEGMSLRDYFAGQALMSLPHLCAHDTLLDGITFEHHVARNAYKMADAMLAEREGGDA